MRTSLVGALGLAAIIIGACGDDATENAGTPDGGDPANADAANVDGANGADGGSSDGATVDGIAPSTTTCTLETLADTSGATNVATDAELRAALAAGRKVNMTADITATAPYPVTKPTILDGGGFTLSGNQATHLITARMTDLTVQNITMRDGKNLVPASQHFSAQSGAAIMIHGGNGTTDGP